MRILFLYDFPLWGSGSANFIRHLTIELANKGHKIGIVCPEKRSFSKKIKQYNVRLPQIPVFIGHPELRGAKKYSELTSQEITEIYNAFLKKTVKASREFRPNLIHVQHVGLITWVARYLKAIRNIRYIITSHGSCLHNIEMDRRYFPLTAEALEAARAITVVSGDTRDWLIRMFGQHLSRKLRTIPGGIDLKYFPENKRTTTINKKYRLNGKKVVLFTGRLVSVKGIEYLIKAASNIQGDIYIVGDGPEKSNLEKLIKKLKLDNVHILGYLGGAKRKELIKFYYRADVFVAPSVWSEPLGLTILEAMAARTPVIVTRKGGITLAVKENYNGLFIRPRNSTQIAEMVNRLLEDKELSERLARNARQTIKEKFTWRKIARRFEILYRKNVNHCKK